MIASVVEIMKMRNRMREAAGSAYNENSWGFGQIYALTTWFPLLPVWLAIAFSKFAFISRPGYNITLTASQRDHRTALTTDCQKLGRQLRNQWLGAIVQRKIVSVDSILNIPRRTMPMLMGSRRLGCRRLV